MKKLDFGKNIGILANVGVLVGILLLAYELNQNRVMIQAQTRRDLTQGFLDQVLLLATEFPDLLNRARSDFSALSETDRARYNAFVNARLRYWEDVHFQYRLSLHAAQFVSAA